MKRTAFPVLLLLAACGGAGEQGAAGNGAAAPAPGEPDRRIECRPAGESAFERACTIETSESAEGRLITIRKADGGFRRLRVTTDGRGVVAADGAEQARVTILDGARIEVEIGGDRFRLPARVRGQ